MSGGGDELAEAMIPVAARLVVAVHGEGGRDDVAALWAELTPQEHVALAVVLAAMVNPDRSLGAALGWITWDEKGDPLSPGLAETRTIRDVAVESEVVEDEDEFVDPVVIDRALSGGRVEATAVERRAVFEAAVERGVAPVVVAAGLGIDLKLAQKSIERARARLTAAEAASPTQPSVLTTLTRSSA